LLANQTPSKMMSLSAAQMQEQLGPVVPVDDDDPSMALALPIVKTSAYRSESILHSV
jgi:hypothetical protein